MKKPPRLALVSCVSQVAISLSLSFHFSLCLAAPPYFRYQPAWRSLKRPSHSREAQVRSTGTRWLHCKLAVNDGGGEVNAE
ncbi:hypothetical protein V8C37DRAFT_390687 [Trichoderma ceciliae]